MRTTACVLLGWMMCGSASAGSFIWFNGAANPVQNGETGAGLAADDASPVSGCFAQLVCAGEDGAVNPARDRGTGVTGDDRVVATRWFGAGVFGEAPGVLGPGSPVQASSGERFYVRAWSAPAADYAAGIPPLFDTQVYGDSRLWEFAGGGDAPMPPVNYNFGGAGFATMLKAGADADGDQLPDWWEFLHFRNTTGAAAATDSDGDGQGNLEEFVAGTSPLNAESVFAAAATRDAEGVVVRWPSDEDRTYTLYRSVDLAAGFVRIAAGVAATPPLNEYREKSAPGGGCAFYLVEVAP